MRTTWPAALHCTRSLAGAGRVMVRHRCSGACRSSAAQGTAACWGFASRADAPCQRFGKLPFEELFAPAIEYARSGYPVSPLIASLWARIADKYQGQPGFDEAFLPGGKSPLAGDIFINRALAQTLGAIAGSKGTSSSPTQAHSFAGKAIKSLWLLAIHSSGFSIVGMCAI